MQFELAFNICEEVLKKKPEKIISKIMKLQKILINNKDAACHLMADVIEVPIEIEPIIEELKDEDYNVRRNAAEELGETKDAKAVGPLIEALKDEDNIFLNIQWKAADALCEIGGERVIELLVQGLKDENKGVREGAAYALGKIKDCKKYKKGKLYLILRSSAPECKYKISIN